MSDLERLDFHVSSRLQAHGGILDRLDYGRLSRLGVQLRDIPSPRDNWDIPPSSLQGWVESYAATVESVQLSESIGLLTVLAEASDEIRQVLSIETLLALDAQIVEPKELKELIDRAKAKDRFKHFDF